MHSQWLMQSLILYYKMYFSIFSIVEDWNLKTNTTSDCSCIHVSYACLHLNSIKIIHYNNESAKMYFINLIEYHNSLGYKLNIWLKYEFIILNYMYLLYSVEVFNVHTIQIMCTLAAFCTFSGPNT